MSFSEWTNLPKPMARIVTWAAIAAIVVLVLQIVHAYVTVSLYK